MERITDAEYVKLIAKKIRASYDVIEVAVILFGRNFDAIKDYVCRKRLCC